MTELATTTRAAWGLALDATSAVLTRVLVDNAGGLTIQQSSRFATTAGSSGAIVQAELLSALSQIPSNEPLGVCFPDSAMMCRGLSLPNTPSETTEKMVQAQAAALFFDGSDRLKIAWRSVPNPFDPSMQWIVIAAVQRRWLDELRESLPANGMLQALSPRAFAVDNQNGDDKTRFCVDVRDQNITFVLRAGEVVLRALVIEREPEVTGEWLQAIRQTFLSLMDGISRNRWPAAAELRADVGDDLQQLVQVLTEVLPIKLEVKPSIDAAASIAMRALGTPAQPAINFAEPAMSIVPTVSISRTILIRAAAACLAGILLWYGLDCLRDWSLGRRFQQLRDAEASSGGADRRLAVNRYLEKNVSPALIVLDVILSASQSLTMSSFGVNAVGQVHLSGTVNSASDVDDLMHKLQASPALTNVQLRSAKIEQNRWQIDMTADAKPMSGLMPATPTPSKAAGNKLALAGGT